jgi:leucyl aminopeptidase
MKIEFAATGATPRTSAGVAVLSLEKGALTPAAAAVDATLSGQISRAIAAGRFTGAKGQTLDLITGAADGPVRVAVIGTGAANEISASIAETAAASAWKALASTGVTTVIVQVGNVAPEVAAQAAYGVQLAAYRFDRYRTTEKPEARPSVTQVVVELDAPAGVEAAHAPLQALADATIFARDLVSEPANILYPAEFAARVKALETLGLTVEVLGEAEMTKLGMGSLLGVGQGSRRESQLVVIQWKGASDPNAQPVAFVGKGVTFDTGGISLKPADGMEDMKWDMGGAAAVSGLMHALAGRKAKVNAVGILGLVENMPDGNAQRPGDIVTSMSGQTIEVINTDAEGRLVLADALWYCQDRFKPQFMIDLATLTGAIIIALGNDYAGLFSNDDALAGKLLAASEATGEPIWRLPIPPAYEKQLDSMAADMKNVGGRPAGSITAALFLQRFVNKLPWAHLDIASTAWKKPSAIPTIPDGATGFGVRLLNQLVADNYEG